MSTIITRTGKGSALTVAEMDANLNALNTDKLELDDISVTTGAPSNAGALAYNNATGVFTFQAADLTLLDFAALDDFSITTAAASSGGALSYDNTTGVFTFTPADVSGASLTGITDNATASVITISDNTTEFDTSIELTSGHSIDCESITNSVIGGTLALSVSGFGNSITLDTSDLYIPGTIQPQVANGNLNLKANGTGSVELTGGVGLNLKSANNIFTNTADTDIILTPTGLIELGGTAYFSAGIEEEVFLSTTTSGNYAPAATDGSIHYVVMSNNMTINGFTNVSTGQTITLAFNGTGGTYSLNLGNDIMTPGGSLALTPGGFDIVTITCLDDATPSYIATAVNNFQ